MYIIYIYNIIYIYVYFYKQKVISYAGIFQFNSLNVDPAEASQLRLATKVAPGTWRSDWAMAKRSPHRWHQAAAGIDGAMS